MPDGAVGARYCATGVACPNDVHVHVFETCDAARAGARPYRTSKTSTARAKAVSGGPGGLTSLAAAMAPAFP